MRPKIGPSSVQNAASAVESAVHFHYPRKKNVAKVNDMVRLAPDLKNLKNVEANWIDK